MLIVSPDPNPTKGSNFKTHSVFFNDLWRVNPHLSLNLGVRYDRNGGVNSAGTAEVDGAKISPRLGLTYDPSANGNWVVNASYATYVAAISNSFANSASSAGSAAR